MKNSKKSQFIDFKDTINQSIKLKNNLEILQNDLYDSIRIIYKALKKKKKIFFCGNGGSAADAQHLAAELLIRLRPHINRISLPAMSLSLDSSTLTACGNDYDFKQIFSRPLESLGNTGDVLVAISTSGNSENVINAIKIARKKKIKIIGFLGKKGGLQKKLCDINLIVPSNVTARIQECHIFLGHYILENVEKRLFNK